MIPPAVEKLLGIVFQRASLDADFRGKLLASPETALEEGFGITVPAGFRIKFVERDSDYDAVYVLPDLKPARDQLSDADLDAVAGGVTTYRWDDID